MCWRTLFSIIFSVDCLFSGFHPNPANRQSTEKHNTYQFLYIYSIPPDDGLQRCPKHVEVDWRNELRINIASSWFLLHRNILLHTDIYEITVLLLRTPRFPEIGTCETTDELDWVTGSVQACTEMLYFYLYHEDVWGSYSDQLCIYFLNGF